MIYGGIFSLNVLTFSALRLLTFFSISDKEASLREKDAGFRILFLIKKYLDDAYLHFKITLFTMPDNSLFHLLGVSFPIFLNLLWHSEKTAFVLLI